MRQTPWGGAAGLPRRTAPEPITTRALPARAHRVPESPAQQGYAFIGRAGTPGTRAVHHGPREGRTGGKTPILLPQMLPYGI